MTSEAPDVAATLEGWAFGFAAVRGYATPLPTSTGLWIEIGETEQKGRHVLRGFEPENISALARSIDRPHVYLEIAATHDDVAPLLPAGWTMRNPAFLMTLPIAAAAESAAASADYDAQIIDEGGIITVEMRDRSGEIAASGKGAFTDDCLTFDKIVTNEAHRRRGLGSTVMRLLTSHATQCGARRGLLIATPDGRALYQRLGWTLASPIASVISPS